MENLYHLGRSYLHRGPSYLIFFVTSKCDARCKMCFYWNQTEEATGRRELSVDEIDRISRNMNSLASLSISGGEPTLRRDLDAIVSSFYRNSGTRFVTFSTNGINPERVEEAASRILERCPKVNLKIYVSIDNLEDKHDEIRGVRGAFGKALETTKRIKELKKGRGGLSFFVETVLSSYNKSDISDIIDFVDKEVGPDSHSISLARGNTRENEARSVSLEEYEAVMNRLKAGRATKKSLQNALLDLMMEVNLKTLRCDEMVLPCMAGRKTMTIFDDGTVAPCEMLPQFYPDNRFIIGSLREFDYDINRLMKSEQAKRALEFIDATKCHCSFECATLCNIVFNTKTYPRILKRLML